MKNILLAAIMISAMACGSNAEGTGNEGDNMQTKTETVNNTPQDELNLRDSTPTTNNNAYNTDSALGQGTTYDSSSNNKKKQ